MDNLDLMEGHISRRRFLSGSAAAVGLSAVGLPGLLVPASQAVSLEFDRRWLAARDAIRAGRLGRILWAQASFRGSRGLGDAVAAIQTVLGEPAVRVTSYGCGGLLPVFVKVDYGSGPSATLVSSMAGMPSAPAFVRGTSATLWFTASGLEIWHEGSGRTEMVPTEHKPTMGFTASLGSDAAAVVRAARTSLLENRPVEVGGRWQL